MRSMFQGAVTFNQNISGWQTSNVTHMDHMFELATIFLSIFLFGTLVLS